MESGTTVAAVTSNLPRGGAGAFVRAVSAPAPVLDVAVRPSASRRAITARGMLVRGQVLNLGVGDVLK